MDKLTEIFGQLAEVLISEGGNKEQIVKIFELNYNELIGKYRPLVEATPLIVGKVSIDLAPIAVAILCAINKVTGDKKVRAELEVWRNRVAKGRYEDMKAYTDAGFTREEAMSLVMLDVANIKTVSEVFNARLATTNRNK